MTVYTNFFGGSFFGGGFFGPGVEPTPATPENPIYSGGATRGRQYVERLSKKEELLERIALGILPAQIAEANEAAIVAARAEIRVEKALQPQGDEVDTALQTEQAAKELYFEVYREFMLADAIERQWKADVDEHRTNIKRAAATLLLLH